MAEILVTCYRGPDLDAVGSAVAYAEYLSKKGMDAEAGIFGDPYAEVKFALEKTDLGELKDAKTMAENAEEIRFVDTSYIDNIQQFIDREKVTEIIDHREDDMSDQFPEAESQVEKVGSAATLMGEKFQETGMEISKDSAILLYLAIVSNTVDFEADVTTKRDREIAEWLEEKIEIRDEEKWKLFENESDQNRSLKEKLKYHYYPVEIKGEKIGISQLEILEAEKFAEENRKRIKSGLKKLREEENLDKVFLTCLDPKKKENIFISVRNETKELIEKALDVYFTDSKAARDGVILRKEIIPELQNFISSHD